MALCFHSSFFDSIPRNLSDNDNLEELPNDVLQGASGPVILWVASLIFQMLESRIYKLEVNILQFRETSQTGLPIKIKFCLHHLKNL